jgi:hypothetical protein
MKGRIRQSSQSILRSQETARDVGMSHGPAGPLLSGRRDFRAPRPGIRPIGVKNACAGSGCRAVVGTLSPPKRPFDRRSGGARVPIPDHRAQPHSVRAGLSPANAPAARIGPTARRGTRSSTSRQRVRRMRARFDVTIGQRWSWSHGLHASGVVARNASAVARHRETLLPDARVSSMALTHGECASQRARGAKCVIPRTDYSALPIVRR